MKRIKVNLTDKNQRKTTTMELEKCKLTFKGQKQSELFSKIDYIAHTVNLHTLNRIEQETKRRND